VLLGGVAQAAQTSRVSVSSSGAQGDKQSVGGSLSADGRYVAFASDASNLVPDDTNNMQDIFVRDLQTGTITRVSVGLNGVQSNSSSAGPSISGDGRYIAFESAANNLVPNDTNGLNDIFVYDRQTGVTRMVSIAGDGTQGNFHSQLAYISDDGRYVAFTSRASTLVANDTNNGADAFVHDLQTSATTRVSVASNGAQTATTSGLGLPGSRATSISADGRYVTFTSNATNLVPGDTNREFDVFVHDRQTATTTRVNVSSQGVQGNSSGASPSDWGSLSADGRYVVFASYNRNLVANDTNGTIDSFLRDRQLGTTTRISVGLDGAQANGGSISPRISADGRYISFFSDATNLVPGDTNDARDIFVYDRQTGITTRVNVDSNGAQTSGLLWGQGAGLSADGRYIVFTADATDLVPNDTNGVSDVFVRDRDGDGFSTISINNARTFDEGSAGAPGSTVFTITLSAASALPVTVNYQTADGTAKAALDYVAKSGTVTFTPGQTVKRITVSFIGDDTAEANETFFLDLGEPNGAPLIDSRGSAYIRNDDGPGISIGDALSVTERNSGTSPQAFIVTLSAASPNTVSVDWSTANGTAGPADYVAASGTLIFAPGETSKTIVVQVEGDTTVEPNETYKVNLSNPKFATLSDSQGIAYIINDDTAPGASPAEEPSQ
jgi:archaellum component FlaF (FlaF/FlaG flagellin family)